MNAWRPGGLRDADFHISLWSRLLRGFRRGVQRVEGWAFRVLLFTRMMRGRRRGEDETTRHRGRGWRERERGFFRGDATTTVHERSGINLYHTLSWFLVTELIVHLSVVRIINIGEGNMNFPRSVTLSTSSLEQVWVASPIGGNHVDCEESSPCNWFFWKVKDQSTKRCSSFIPHYIYQVSALSTSFLLHILCYTFKYSYISHPSCPISQAWTYIYTYTQFISFPSSVPPFRSTWS